MSDKSAPNLEGRVLAGRYHLTRLLGAGSMGEVYLALDAHTSGKKVALKLLKESSTVGWFKSEFQTLTLMAHPYIASVYDFAYDADLKAHFYTCEMVEGLPADKALENSSFEDKLSFLVRFLFALDYIHAQGYLHCDIKPQNVLVVTSGSQMLPKVLDFGLATDMPQGTLTSRGTPHYMAPEWFLGGVAGPYTDVYSTAIMFYKILYGSFPFQAKDARACIEFHTKGQLTFPTSPSYPSWVHTLLLRMTARDTKERIPSASECLTAIQQMSGMPRLPGSGLETEVAEEGVGGPWLGRQELLTQLLANTQNLLEGHAEALPLQVLRGPSGAGHTRCLIELRRRLQLQGVCVHHIAAGSAGATPLQMLTHSLLGGELGSEAGALDERVSHTVARLVEKALQEASTAPSVFLIDDGDRLDEPTATFVRELVNRSDFARSSGGQPLALAVVVAAPERPGKAAHPWPHHRLARLHTLPLLEQTHLPRFLRLVLRTPEIPNALVHETFAVCAGNPKLTVEFLAFLRRSGIVSCSPQRTEFHSERLVRERLPQTLEDYLGHALEALDANDRKVLEAAALSFSPLTRDGLQAATELAEADVLHSIESLQRQGLLRRIGTVKPPLFEVRTDSLRSVLQTQCVATVAKRLHHRLALWFETAGGHLDACSWHQYQAGDRKEAAAHVLMGVEQALGRLDFDRTMQLLGAADELGMRPAATGSLAARAFRLWGRYEEGVTRVKGYLERSDAAGRDELSVDIAELHFRAGQYAEAHAILLPLASLEAELGESTGEFAAAEEVTEPEVRSAPPSRPPCEAGLRGRALALMARVLFYLGKHEQARMVGEKGMGELGSHTREFCLCAAMVGLVRVYGGKLQQGAKYLETALANLRRCGSPSDLAFVSNALGLAYHRMKEFAKARQNYGESLAIARKCGDMERINVAIMNLSVVLQESGDYAEAIARYQEALALAFQTENQPVLARVYGNLGNIHRYLGMLQKARDYAQRSLELAIRLNQPLLKSVNTMLMGEIALFSGEFDDATGMLTQALAEFRSLAAPDEETECLIDLAEASFLSGDRNRAMQHGREALALAQKHSLLDHQVRASLALGRAVLGKGEGDAQATLELLSTCTGVLQARPNLELEFKLAILQGQAMQKLGQHEAAGTVLNKAISLLERLKQRIPAEFGASFFSRRDRQEVQAELTHVQSAFTQLEATLVPSSSSLSMGPDPRVGWMIELIRLYRKLLGQRDIEQVLEAIIDVTVDLSGAERGFVLLPASTGFDVVVARNMDREGIRKSRTKFSTSVARQVLESGEILRLEDAIEADDFREQLSIVANRIRSVVCLPLPGRDGTIGALYLDNRFKPGTFSDGVVEMLRAFAEQAALAVETNRLIAGYKSMVDALERSKEEVARLNRELQDTVDAQRVMLVQKDDELKHQQEQLATQYGFSNFIGRSAPMARLFATLTRIRDTAVPVLVTGESGTGKELVARALHFTGPRKQARFVSINCAALPDTLLESELFGYARGAFTGAVGEKRGLFAAADQGTLFMDEVGDMSLTLQAKLLRVIQEGEFCPLGSTKTVKVDVRIISATNRDLPAMVKEGSFRQDLYYRLDVVSVQVPPLRERRDDIPLLVDHFLAEFAKRNSLERPRVHPEAMRVLMEYDWPGNVRELQSVVQTAAVFAERGTITVDSLRTKPEVFGRTGLPSSWGGDMPLDLRTLESRAVETALSRCNGNKVQAAKLLGISRRALYNKLPESNQ